MNGPRHIVLMAQYNAWMNAKLVEAAARLPAAEISRDRGAFFRSILGTLNHLMVGDTLWLRRFRTHPAGYATLDPVMALPVPSGLDERLYSDLPSLAIARQVLDAAITQWAVSVRACDLDHLLPYTSSAGKACARRFGDLIVHFFNHQTHHRGQATTLLTQAGVDVGVTDLVALIPDEA
ncbi:DinB family protein [Nitrospirillum iridis]|uniref:Putative damage-inducible protein DinB n=1 Tax=Nitrospirillum iridis TaxID=765888 RepID=A0A7X0B2Z8_9PROT|nr:DinB family protein [Nitrospirillum iridis]MBB6254780.1 putative damage-inducible protein DinB [Nitrospirillum iridis]